MFCYVGGWDFAECFTENWVKNDQFRMVLLQVLEAVPEAVDFAVSSIFASSGALWRGNEAGKRNNLVWGVN